MGLLQLNIGTSAYAQMLRVVSRFHEAIYSDPESPTGLNQNLDFRSVILEHDEQLSAYFTEWNERFQRDTDMTGLLLISSISSGMSELIRVKILPSSSVQLSFHCRSHHEALHNVMLTIFDLPSASRATQDLSCIPSSSSRRSSVDSRTATRSSWRR